MPPAFIVVPISAFADNHELAREPRGIDTPAPEAARAGRAPAQKITIYTAKTIVTLDPGTPTAEAVAVMNGKILGVGTLDEVQGWVTNQEVEIDRRFEDAVIVPGLIEAHMHPQITGVLWDGVYVGRFDRTAPDGTLVKGLETKQAVLDRLQGGGCQTAERRKLGGGAGAISRSSTATRRSPAPTSIRSPTAIRSSSRICRCTSTTPTARRSRSPASATTPMSSASSRRTASRPARSRRSRRRLTFVAKLPPLDAKTLVKATWGAAELAHRVGVTTFADLSFGSLPGGYKAYQTVAADPNFPVRIVLNPIIQVFESPEVAAKGGLDSLTEWHKSDTDRLSFGGVKFVVDGSIQGYTGLFQWPYYYKTFANGVANISQDDLTKGVIEVHKRGFQAVIHANADEATEMALNALDRSSAQISAAGNQGPARAQSICDAKPAGQNEGARRRHQPLHQPHLLLGRPALFDIRGTGPGGGHEPGWKRAAPGHSLQPCIRMPRSRRSIRSLHVDGDGAQDHVRSRARRGRAHHRSAGACTR